MTIALHFAEGYAVYRLVGEFALQAAVAAVTQAIELCRQHQVRRLLIDATALTGVKSPSLIERYEIVAQWALAAKGAVKIAVVPRPEMLDPTKFGITVARNRGLEINPFTSEAEALAWLLGPQAAD
jgi:hypothetical protein